MSSPDRSDSGRNEIDRSPVMFNLSEVPSSRKLVERKSTFWPTDQELLVKHPSLELLNPHHDCSSRRSSPSIAIFNLLATVCGGGVLSLPIAFARAGIIPATLLMVFSSVISDFAMYILCSCARRTGGRSYSDVARNAFGKAAEMASTVLLFTLLIFILVAYMVLVKDIWTGVILHILPGLEKIFNQHAESKDEDSLLEKESDYMLFVILLVVSPLLFKKDLHALRHTCYVGFASLLVLTVAVINRAYELNFKISPEMFHEKVLWWGDGSGILFAFPIIALSFFSIYNVLSVHSALVNPTRSRVKFVLDGTMVLCFVLFYIVGLCGYLYAYDKTLDNIILNFPLSFKIILIGRLGYGFTLMFGMPLILLPCRAALLSFPQQFREWREGDAESTTPESISLMTIKEGERYVVNGVNFDEERPLLGLKKSSSLDPKYMTNTFQDNLNLPKNGVSDGKSNSGKETESIVELLPKLSENQADDGESENETIHIASTVGIVLFCYFLGVSVPGVAVVWSICGSSMALLIGFFIPSACYLKIRTHKRLNPRSIGAWALMIFSIVASIVCTTQTIVSLS